MRPPPVKPGHLAHQPDHPPLPGEMLHRHDHDVPLVRGIRQQRLSRRDAARPGKRANPLVHDAVRAPLLLGGDGHTRPETPEDPPTTAPLPTARPFLLILPAQGEQLAIGGHGHQHRPEVDTQPPR